MFVGCGSESWVHGHWSDSSEDTYVGQERKGAPESGGMGSASEGQIQEEITRHVISMNRTLYSRVHQW